MKPWILAGSEVSAVATCYPLLQYGHAQHGTHMNARFITNRVTVRATYTISLF